MAPNGTISGYRDPGLGVVTQDETERAWALALGISFFTFLPLRHAHIHELLPLYRYCAHLSNEHLVAPNQDSDTLELVISWLKHHNVSSSICVTWRQLGCHSPCSKSMISLARHINSTI